MFTRSRFRGKRLNKKACQEGRKDRCCGCRAFGGWTALHLLRKGYDVTLVDQFGPGNNQSSSGGETRLIRAFYDKQVYFDLTRRAMELWKENEPRIGQKVSTRTD
ncbi:MAG: FAD-dependent oxidoreductase [Bacteroidota bacterium]